MATTHGDLQLFLPLPVFSTLNRPEILHQSYDGIADLRERQLLCLTALLAAGIDYL